MALQLIFLETIIKAVVGALLLAFPRTLSRILGLGPTADTLMPRLLGALFVSLSAATFLDGRIAAHNGLGLTGLVAINLILAMTIFALLIVGRASPSRIGRVLLGLIAGAMLVLALFEIAWA
jgi:hypothetical protein